MSREIKFKFIWSNPTKTNFLTEIFTLDQIEHGDQFMVLDNQPFFRDYRVIARLQSTNLLDKNGKEIYEGDIVRLIETVKILHEPEFEYINFIGKIEWDNEGADYNIIGNDKDNFRGLGNGQQEIEVLGNIYENPELITGVKNV